MRAASHACVAARGIYVVYARRRRAHVVYIVYVLALPLPCRWALVHAPTDAVLMVYCMYDQGTSPADDHAVMMLMLP